MEIPSKSKASVLVEYGQPHQIQQIKIPEVEEGGILVKVRLAGICGTDVHQHAGDLALTDPLPIIQGHETLGQIVKLGKRRTKDVVGQELKVGDRILWAHQFCGECYYCRIVRKPHMCINNSWYGFQPAHSLRGGFAEYEYITPSTEVIKVPDEVTDEEAIGVGCAFRSVVAGFEKLIDHSGIGFADTVVIQGAGPIGLYSCVSAAESGAGQVIVVGAPQERLELAKKWGATHVINIEEIREHEQRVKKVLELTEERGAEVVIECSGHPQAFVQGFDFMMRGGTFLVLGQTSSSAVQFVPHTLLIKQAVVLGSGSADIRHFYKALRFIKCHRHKYPFDEIVTKTFRLDQVDEALASMRKGEVVKAVIDNR